MKIFFKQIIKQDNVAVECERCGCRIKEQESYYIAYMNWPYNSIKERLYCVKHGTSVAQTLHNDWYVEVSVSYVIRLHKQKNKKLKLNKLYVLKTKEEKKE